MRFMTQRHSENAREGNSYILCISSEALHRSYVSTMDLRINGFSTSVILCTETTHFQTLSNVLSKVEAFNMFANFFLLFSS